MNTNDINKKLFEEYQNLVLKQWKFLDYGWQIVAKRKNHRTKILKIDNIEKIKKKLEKKLGIIPVYYFLTILFEAYDYKGPYNNVEKGLVILYYLVENISMDEMNDYIPKSSFYDIYREFYIKKCEKLNKILNYSLENMFSNIRIRLFSALLYNPALFTQVTLYLDGHDTRGIEIGCKNKADYYSYKLKKAGLRTQICIDPNDMILYVSKSEPCGINNDGSMFLRMKIEKKINNIDCMALDGGYNLYVKQIIDNSDLNDHNFVYPIRKEKNINLNEIEIEYNEQFGSFRSKIEKTFADLGSTFKRFNNKKPIRTTDKDILNIQFKIAIVLMNIKKFVKITNLNHKDYHTYWLNENFDFEIKCEYDIIGLSSHILPNINDRINNLRNMKELQKQFLGLETSYENNLTSTNQNVQEDEYMENNYEVERILDHKGISEFDSFYLVKWKGYDNSENSWVHYSNFNTKECISNYWKSSLDE